MKESYKVKGSTIRSKLDYVERDCGAEARAELESRFTDSGLFPLLTASWYDYDLYVEVLEAVAERCFGGDLSRLVEVGADSAKSALTTVYQAFVRDRGFHEFLEGISKLHHLFYDRGHLEVELDRAGKSCAIRHRDKPRFAEADLHVATGFYTRAAELHGLSNVQCSFQHTDEGVDFQLRWA